MLGRLFTCSAAVSLAVCLAAAALWVRSHRTHVPAPLWEGNVPTAGGDRWALDTAPDVLTVSEHPSRWRAEMAARARRLETLEVGFGSDWVELGIGSGQAKPTGPPLVRPLLQDGKRAILQVGMAAYRAELTRSPLPPKIYSVPFWRIVAAAAAVPACWTIARVGRTARRKRRRRRGLCPACGYDVRAGPEQGAAFLARCPECGTATTLVGAAA